MRPGLLGTVAVSGAFVALFVLAALQAALVQGQLRLDRLNTSVNEAEGTRDRLALQVNTLESPERLAEEARELGMVPAPDVVFLYAPLPGGSAPEVVPSAGPAAGRVDLDGAAGSESDDKTAAGAATPTVGDAVSTGVPGGGTSRNREGDRAGTANEPAADDLASDGAAGGDTTGEGVVRGGAGE